ncbi:MAG: glycosyltransferase family 4 protein [Bacteroidales bacterium]|nr:glycosyltransferase family 4 protein [Bacteroidales bacterium]
MTQTPSRQHSILFLATEYASGMRPYACTIIHNMWNDRSHAIVVVKDEKYKQDFAHLDPERVHFITYPTGKLGKLWFKLHPTALIKEIDRILEQAHIDVVYSLTGELVLCSSIAKIQKKVPVLYTVHDAIPHETKLPFVTLVKERLIVTWPQRALLRKTKNKITNSQCQLNYIKAHYPHSEAHYAPFPSLVNADIASGTQKVKETEGIADYILFFGNVDIYKGVHYLHECYVKHPELHDRALVLAGAGHYYFSIPNEQGRTVVINRFVDDKELADLFNKAAVVVYPYMSATQSGVISIASFFKRPIVLSDVGYFKEVATGFEGISFFENGNIDQMATAIMGAINSEESSQRIYKEVYSPHAMVEAITLILQKLI